MQKYYALHHGYPWGEPPGDGECICKIEALNIRNIRMIYIEPAPHARIRMWFLADDKITIEVFSRP
jgi:hypothetical protein